jgi:hypothetical protein
MVPPNDWVFYHALYCVIAHWAAFNATLGLLVTLALVLYTVAIPHDMARRHSAEAVVLIIASASWYSLWRMHTYMKIVDRMLPAWYIQELSGGRVVGPMMIAIVQTPENKAGLYR